MSRDVHYHPSSLNRFADDTLFVGFVRDFTADLEQALFAHQSFDQRRPQRGADGVGTLDAQDGAVFGRRQIAR